MKSDALFFAAIVALMLVFTGNPGLAVFLFLLTYVLS